MAKWDGNTGKWIGEGKRFSSDPIDEVAPSDTIGWAGGKVPFFDHNVPANVPFNPSGGETPLPSVETPQTPAHEIVPGRAEESRRRSREESEEGSARFGSQLGKTIVTIPGAVYDRDNLSWIAMEKDGDRKKVPFGDVQKFYEQGFFLIETGKDFKTDDELRNEHILRGRSSNQGLGDKLLAGAQSLANTASFGAGEELARGLGLGDAVDQIAEKQRANPVSSAGGAIAATIIPAGAVERAVAGAISKVPHVARALASESALVRSVVGGARGAVSGMAAGNSQRAILSAVNDTSILGEGWSSFGLDNLIDAGLGGLIGAATGAGARLASLKGTPGEALANELRATAKDAGAASRAVEAIKPQVAAAESSLVDALAAEGRGAGEARSALDKAASLKAESLALKTAEDLPMSETFAKERDVFLRDVPEPPVGAPASQQIQYANARGTGSTDAEFAAKGLVFEAPEKAKILAAAKLGKLKPQLDTLREQLAGMVEAGPTISSRAHLSGNTALARKIDRAIDEARDVFKIKTEFDPSIDGPLKRVYIGDASDVELLTGFISPRGQATLNAMYDHLNEGMRAVYGGGDISMVRTITSDGMASTMDSIDDIADAVRGAADEVELPGVGGEMFAGAEAQAAHIPDTRHGAPTFTPGGMKFVSEPERMAEQALRRSEVAPQIVDELRASEDLIAIRAPGKEARIRALDKGGRVKGKFSSGLIATAEKDAEAALARWEESKAVTSAAADRAANTRLDLKNAKRPLDAVDEAAAELRTIIKDANLPPPSEADVRAARRLVGHIYDDETVRLIATAEKYHAATGGASKVGRLGRAFSNAAIRATAWNVMGGGFAGRAAGNLAVTVGSKIASGLGFVAGPVQRLTPAIRKEIQDKDKNRSPHERALEGSITDMQSDAALKGMEADIDQKLMELTKSNAQVASAWRVTALRRNNLLFGFLGRSPSTLEINGKIVPRTRNADETRTWKALVRGSRSPAYLYQEIAERRVNPVTVEAFRETWPPLYEAARQIVAAQVANGEYEDPAPVIKAFGLKMDQTLPRVLQGSFGEDQKTATMNDIGSQPAADSATQGQTASQ